MPYYLASLVFLLLTDIYNTGRCKSAGVFHGDNGCSGVLGCYSAVGNCGYCFIAGRPCGISFPFQEISLSCSD